MSEGGKHLGSKTRNFFDEGFRYISTSPLMIGICAGMTILVIGVPFSYILYPEMYTNTPHASAFFKTLKFSHLLNNLLLVSHIAAAVPAILFGPFLFIEGIRRDHIRVHRIMGQIYVFGTLYSAVTVFPLALSNLGGTVAHIGFGTMSVVWFFTTYFGYCAVMNKDLVAHRRWLMRSYALTFAFVHVNLTYKLLLPYEQLTVQGIKAFQSMVSWQGNLMLVEIYLAATTHTGRFTGWKKFLRHATTWSRFDKFYFRPFRPQAASTKEA